MHTSLFPWNLCSEVQTKPRKRLDYLLKAHPPSRETCIDERMFSNESVPLLHCHLLIKNVGLRISNRLVIPKITSWVRNPRGSSPSPWIQESPVWFNIASLSQRPYYTKRRLTQPLKISTGDFIVVLHLHCSAPFRGERRDSDAENMPEC